MDARMTLTLHELQDRLKEIDEISILEILNISTEDLVNMFEDKIEQNYDTLVKDFDNENKQTSHWQEE